MRNVWDEGAVDGRMRDAIALWMRMYVGDAPWVREDGVVSLNLPAFVAGEVARLATIEMQSAVRGEGERAAFLDEAYQRVLGDARRFTEYAAAGGTLALKPYWDGAALRVDYVKAGDFMPTAYDANGQVTGCVFLDRAVRGKKAYIRLERHMLDADGYRIENRAYEADGDEIGREMPLAVVDRWAALEEEAYLAGVTRPLFALLKMPQANMVDPDSPLGVSAYARAVDLMREADRQFSRLLWEMESGERALYVDIRAFMPEESEPGTLPFKRFYRTMDVDAQADTLFAEWSPGLREKSQIGALNEILQRVEDACGLARGTLSEAPESSARGARTATELKIMRQRTFATVLDAQRAVEVALRGLVEAMDAWAGVLGVDEGEWTVGFMFDDSVVSDRGEAFEERLRLVEAGVLTVEEMRSWYLGE